MLREGERVWGGYLSISIATIGTVFNLLTIIVVSIDYFAPSNVEGCCCCCCCVFSF